MWFKQALVVVVVGLLLLLYVFVFDPENLFNLPRRNPIIWLAMLIFYPAFSAYGQEIVYRKFLFMRYKVLFQKNWILILASGIAFSFVHIVYFNVLSLILTFFAGIYFACIYNKTKSVLFVSMIHGILGFFIFTVGMGQYFWINMLEKI
jgi:membrane protease YdiL (CAAX protease family)